VTHCLSCCATNRKVTVSIPDGVIGIFHWHNPSNCTMALGSTQSLTEMSTRRISWGVNAAGAWGWQPYHLLVLLSWNLGSLTSWNPLGQSRPVTGLLYLYLYLPLRRVTVCHHISIGVYWTFYHHCLLAFPSLVSFESRRRRPFTKYNPNPA